VKRGTTVLITHVFQNWNRKCGIKRAGGNRQKRTRIVDFVHPNNTIYVHIYSFLLVAGLQTRTVNQSKRA
jgi:hypothetical protein